MSCNAATDQTVEDNARDWKDVVATTGALKLVALDDGVNGWASPPGHAFNVRGPNYLIKRQKVPAGDWLLKPLGVDWLRSKAKLDNVLSLPDNRVVQALQKARQRGDAHKPFIFAVNLQVPGRENYSAVFYFVSEEPVPKGSLFYRFIQEDDVFRNSRFKLINRIVRGPWIVRATVGNYAACLLGKALTCRYIRGRNYLEIDVDIGSSALASAICHLALGSVSSVVVDMGFLVESQAEEELPERLLGAVRIAQIQMSSAAVVEVNQEAPFPQCPASGSSWRIFSRGISFRGHTGKPGKIEAEEEGREE